MPARKNTAAHLVDVHAHGVHGGVADPVVRRVDEDLVKDLEEAGRVRDGLEHHALAVVDPQRLLLLLGAADVGVGAQQDVLQLRLLLVDVLDGLAGVVALGAGDGVAGGEGLAGGLAAGRLLGLSGGEGISWVFACLC